MKKLCLVFICVFSLFTSIAYAVTPNCPSVSSVKATRFDMADYSDGTYAVGTSGFKTLGTNNPWIVLLGEFPATSNSDAINKGHTYLKSVVGPYPSKPEQINIDGYDWWACVYPSTQVPNVFAAAVTPSIAAKTVKATASKAAIHSALQSVK